MTDKTTAPTEATTNILSELAEVMREMGAICKGQRNTQQGFNYRGIDQVYNELHALFAAKGIITLPEVMQEQREERPTKQGGVLAFTRLLVRYWFVSSTDGSRVSCVVQGEAMDSGDKSSNKALSIAHKYALFQMLMIPTDEGAAAMKDARPVDPDGDSHEVAHLPPTPEAQQIAQWINEGVLTEQNIIKRFEKPSAQLTLEEARVVITGVSKRLAEQQAAQ